MKPIIEVNHVWKEYHKGTDRRYKSLRDTLVGMPKRLFGEKKEKFWALEDIDFKVEAGESIGIIGRNGAGKSTLLKILSRITPPTKGEIRLRGRVASLLEVGTGFHPELTGRENVFFNGSILGMKSHEIKRKFDEIVDFSGVESFIDTPLKHYSSGMQMRLAFAVAAHLDSEILLIDEVLAVGDAAFQKKCIGKMGELGKSNGRTIIMVSHDMSQMMQLCSRGILIQQGILTNVGTMSDTINYYLNKIKTDVPKDYDFYSENIEILDLSFNGVSYNKISDSNLELGDKLTIKVNFIIKTEIDNFSIAMDIRNSFGELYTHIINEDDGFHMHNLYQGMKKEVTIVTEGIYFIPGQYNVSLWFGRHQSFTLFKLDNIFNFNLLRGNKSQRLTNFPKNAKVYLHSTWM